jgi:hypothetical protein
MAAPAVKTKQLAKTTPPGNQTARRKKRRALVRERGRCSREPQVLSAQSLINGAISEKKALDEI